MILGHESWWKYYRWDCEAGGYAMVMYDAGGDNLDSSYFYLKISIRHTSTDPRRNCYEFEAVCWCWQSWLSLSWWCWTRNLSLDLIETRLRHTQHHVRSPSCDQCDPGQENENTLSKHFLLFVFYFVFVKIFYLFIWFSRSTLNLRFEHYRVTQYQQDTTGCPDNCILKPSNQK